MIYKACVEKPRCYICAGAHEASEHECPVKGCKASPGKGCTHLPTKCIHCQGPHMAIAGYCPKRKDAIERAKAIKIAQRQTQAETTRRVNISVVVPKVTGQWATGPMATGQGVTGQGVTGQRVTGQGVTGQRASGQGATGQRATGQGATGQRATGQGATGQGATGQRATGQRFTGQGFTGQRFTGQGAPGQGFTRQNTTDQRHNSQRQPTVEEVDPFLEPKTPTQQKC
jgi:hypothetical protein